ncbi:MAG: hypothetical protein O3A95_04080 [Planctomycetota bacterium]|nr:hypothetical protein [Planctomycetota bacterium]MDA1113462.1 hypothetical protein [Planctomycetota bacterium]
MIQERVVVPTDVPAFLSDIAIPRAGTYRVYLQLFDITYFYRAHEVSWPNGEEFLKIEVLNQSGQVIPFSFPLAEIQKVVDEIIVGRDS